MVVEIVDWAVTDRKAAWLNRQLYVSHGTNYTNLTPRFFTLSIDVVLLSLLHHPYDVAAAGSFGIPPQIWHNIKSACCHSNLVFLLMSCRRSTYNHLSSWLTDARNLTNPNTVSIQISILSFCILELLFVSLLYLIKLHVSAHYKIPSLCPLRSVYFLLLCSFFHSRIPVVTSVASFPLFPPVSFSPPQNLFETTASCPFLKFDYLMISSKSFCLLLQSCVPSVCHLNSRFLISR